MLRLTLLGCVCMLIGSSMGHDPHRAYFLAPASLIFAILAVAHYRRHRHTRRALPGWLAWLRRI